MGSKGLNAGTSFENTVYYNSFPSNQLHKWLEVYVERFRNPVFRLFQSELEAVYEEKNMYQDNPIMPFFESVLKESFGEHPYGRPVIGYAEHLKNPQLSKMRDFFNTYYVPNNMTLILVGDLEFDATIAMIEETFGKMSYKAIPDFPTYNLPTFNTPTVIEKRQTPIKLGVMVFNTMPVAHQDNLSFQIISQLLNNDAGTGLFDKIMLNNDVMGAQTMLLPFKQHGVCAFLYVPKILGQSHQTAEKYVLNCLDSLKSGHFSDTLFEAAKMEYLTNEIRNVEGSGKIFNTILEYVMTGKSLSNYYSDMEKIKALTKNDIVEIANKYFTDSYLVYRSKMLGGADKDKVDKPKWAAIDIQNAGAQSEFAKKIANESVEPIHPQVIEFGKDVIINETNPAYKMYAVKNPYNDIFTLKINYKFGEYHNKHLSNAADYVNTQGTKEMSFQDFNMKLQLLGASITLSTDEDLSNIEITGFDKDFEEIIKLCHQKFFNTGNDEKKLNLLTENHKFNLKYVKKDASSCADAVFQYAQYGNDSKYLRMPTSSEISKYSGEKLIGYVQEIFNYNGFITYSGNLEADAVYNSLLKNNFIREENSSEENKEKTSIPIEKPVNKDAVYYLHDKKFLQSNIHFYVSGIQMTGKDKNKILSKCFNQYFGNGMNSIVFQEIREARSLGYAVSSKYMYDYLDRKPSYLHTFLGTQSDKTVEGMEAMRSLITDIPKKEDKFAITKESLLMLEKSNYLDFRALPNQVYKWRAEGYDEHPEKMIINEIENIDFDEVLDFYNRTIKNKPVIISLSGNMDKVNKKELGKFGELHQVKAKDVFCE
jgi:predicted Zn-dependent peptidase